MSISNEDGLVNGSINYLLTNSLSIVYKEINSANDLLGRDCVVPPSVEHLKMLKYMLVKLASEGYLKLISDGRLLPIVIPNLQLNVVSVTQEDTINTILEIPVTSFSIPLESKMEVVIDFLHAVCYSKSEDGVFIDYEKILNDTTIGSGNKETVKGIINSDMFLLDSALCTQENEQTVKITLIDCDKKIIDLTLFHYPSSYAGDSVECIKDFFA